MKLHPYKEIEKSIEFWQKIFIESKKAQNSSKHTIKSYNHIIDEFKEFCYLERVNNYPDLSFKDINRYFINSFINYLRDEKHLESSSIETYINVLKAFFRFISEENTDAEDILTPIEKISIKVPQKEPKNYTREELKKIDTYLREKIEKTKNFKKVRTSFVILFLVYSALRADEVLNIKKKNLSLEKDSDSFKVIVTGKGNKERGIFVDAHTLIEEYEKLISFKEYQEIGDNERIFNISYISLYKYNKNICTKLKIENKGLHAYRHALSIRAVEENTNLQTLKEFLGHSSITTTSKYYARSTDKAKQDLAKKITL